MKLTDINYVKKLMAQYGVHFQKKFGQNFLINSDIPQQIASECGAEENSGILEIGSGIGTLTDYLCQYYKKVVSVEIDSSLIPILEHTMEEYENLVIRNEDILKLDLAQLIETEFAGMPVSVCANLPYYITTPVLMHLLESRIPFDYVTVMIQKEVADRICSPAGKSEYGAITASVSYYGKAEKLFHVSAENFMPVPKVDSTVIRIQLYKVPPVTVCSEKMLFHVIKAAFGQRRKTFVNALCSEFGNFTKEQLLEVVLESGFAADIRGERLNLTEFARIANTINDKLLKL